MGIIEASILFALLLAAPAVLVLLGWIYWRRIGDLTPWRWRTMCAGLIAASAAWVLLAALELPMPYLRKVYGQPSVESFWRHSVPIGLLLSALALPLVLFGRGRGRFFATVAAIGLCWCWYYLALLQ